MRVLLTGSAGFIGSAIRPMLQRAGHDAVCVDLMVPQAHGDTSPAPDTLRLDVREASRSEAWESLLAGVDAVCHQAAIVGVERDAGDLPTYASHNDVGTAALLAAMAQASIQNLVLASSMVVYGEGRYACADHGPQSAKGRDPLDLASGQFDLLCSQCTKPLDWLAVDESAAVHPRSGYAASKVAQEHYSSAWASQVGGRVIALRYHNVYGPGMPRDTSYCGVAATFRSELERGRRPRVFEDGRQTRDFIHVDDVATANLLALESLTTHNSHEMAVYNIASGYPVTIHDVAGIVSGEVPPEITGQYRAGDVRHIVASPERAAHQLGFRARIRPEVGLREFATEPLRPSVEVAS